MEKVVTEQNFAEILKESAVVLVDFWAPWCGPCRSLSPVLDEIAAEYEGKALVAKCNVDDCEDLAVECGIRNVPTILIYKNGEMAFRGAGALSKAEIKEKLDGII